MCKMFLPILLVSLAASAATSNLFAQDCCPNHNTSVVVPPWVSIGNANGHNTGSHYMTQSQSGSCTYLNAPYCDGTNNAQTISQVFDNGQLTKVLDVHETAPTDHGATTTATYPVAPPNATSSGVGGVKECFVSCSFSVTWSGVLGFQTSSAPLWNSGHDYTNACPAVKAPLCGNAPPAAATKAGSTVPPDSPVCCVTPPCGSNTPVLIDVGKEGWHLTDPHKPASEPGGGYVTFNFDGKLLKVAWPDARYNNAWLVYDKNSVIDGADDLFGNFTPHANADYLGVKSYPNPNGFVALGFYDQPAQGGNQDQVLDRNDAIWKHLKLWKPKHCHLQPDQPCVALDSELFSLESQAVHSISLVYGTNNEIDGAGNWCHFKTMINPEPGEAQKSYDGRWACDWSLVTKP